MDSTDNLGALSTIGGKPLGRQRVNKAAASESKIRRILHR